VQDVEAFMKCVSANTPLARVGRDTLLGQKIGLRGTPTIVVNGWKWTTPPNLASLDSIVRSVRAQDARQN
jgi:protein-disulfide isomerase